MLKVSDAFNSAFAAPDRELRARVTIGKTVYDSDDLTSINYDSGAMTGEQFSIGSTYMNSAKIIFSHLVEGLKQLDEVLVEFGVLKPDGTVEYVKMGTFIVDDKIQMDRNNNTTTIECMDRMTMLGGTYVSKLTYPARIKDVAIEIANMAGVKANETSFARLSENKINQPTGYTYRDAIGLIAQFQMGFALFDRDGLLDIRTLQDNSFKIDPNQYFLKGLVKNETFFKLNGISCTVVTTSKDENGNETSKTAVLQSGSSSGAQIKLANNVMTQDVLDRMYEALKFTNYYPFSLNWNGNPAVEAGDWLTVEDLQGNEFKVPNMSYTLTYNGGLTATSKADTSVSSPATYSYGGTISNIVNEIGGRESAEGNHIYEGTEDQEPTLSKEGDLWYKHVGPDTEERIYKDGKWEFLTSTKTANDAADAADKASKEAEEAKKQADDAVNQANQAVADAGFAKQQVIDVDKTANQAKSDAAAAGQQAKDALTNAGTALTNAKTALDNVTKLDQTVKTEVTNINGQLAQKVNQITFDTLKGTVTSQATLINQNNAAIQLKADLSLVNTIKQTVANNTAAIDLNSKEIKLKASQSTVDSLNGTVKNLDAEQKIQAGQIAQTVSKTELTSKLNGYATQTWTQGQIKTTADQINLSVISLKTEVENNGAENLIQNSSFKLGKAGWSGWEGPYIHDPAVETYHSKPYTAVYFGQNKQPYADLIHDGKIPLTPSTSYVFQIKTRSLIKNHPVTYIQEYDAAGKVINDHAFITNVNSPDYITNVQKFTTSVAAEYGVLRIRAQPGDQFMASELMLTEGTIVPKSWYPSSMDNATTADFASLEITIKGIQSTVATKANQSQVTQQAGQINSLVTSVNALNTEYSQVQQTIKGIQTTVGNKADKSQVTQLANQITSTVGSMSNPNLIMNGGYPTSGNHWSGSSDFHVTTHGFYRRGTLFVLNNNSSNEQTIGTERVKVVAGAKYTISMIVFGGSNVASYDIWFLGRKNGSTTNYDISTLVAGAKKPNPSLAEHPNWTFKMPDVDEGYIRIDNNGSTNAPTYSGLYFTEVKLEKGEVATPYVQSAESSEIIQTKEMINLRVQKGDVINQINISPESILIAGQKVHITGQTSIDNAVIKDAMIANVTADKITAGTLNAANVNVINLNANNITTGTIKGANLSLNLNTGEVLFQKGAIRSANGNLNIDIASGRMAVVDKNGDGFFFEDGMLLLSDSWDTGNAIKYGSITYGAGFPASGRGIIIKGASGATLETEGHSDFVGVLTESGINVYPNQIRMTSVGQVNIVGGSEYSVGGYVKDRASISIGSTVSGDLGDRIVMNAEYVHIPSAYRMTASGSANVIVAEDGALVRSTSASKYKTDIIRTNIPDYGEKLLNLPTATWTDIAETKRYRDDSVNQIKPTRNFGMIAEDLAEAGLEMLVVRGTDGELEGINYDRIGPALIPVIAKLKNKIEKLEQKLEEPA
ncbi:MAG: gp58-like family protein [Latilactobacillus curvatus]